MYRPFPESTPCFSPKDRGLEQARIIDGPFKGIEGIVCSTDYSKELFVINIELLQRVAIKLEGFQIEKV